MRLVFNGGGHSKHTSHTKTPQTRTSQTHRAQYSNMPIGNPFALIMFGEHSCAVSTPFRSSSNPVLRACDLINFWVCFLFCIELCVRILSKNEGAVSIRFCFHIRCDADAQTKWEHILAFNFRLHSSRVVTETGLCHWFPHFGACWLDSTCVKTWAIHHSPHRLCILRSNTPISFVHPVSHAPFA